MLSTGPFSLSLGRTFFAWVLLLCWLEAFAQAHGLRVRSVQQELASYEPRQIVTLSFNVSNESDRVQELETRLQLPAGWRPVTPDLPFSLARGESVARFATFVIPDGAVAGDHIVHYVVRSRLQPELFIRYSTTVHVAAMGRLDVSALDAPSAVASGESYRAVFLVRNAGNTHVVAKFRARSSLQHSVAPEEGTVELAPRESRELALEIRSEVVKKLAFEKLSLSVTDGAELTAQAVRVVKLLPAGGSGESLYRTIPGQVRLTHLAQQRDGVRKSGWQTEFAGAGPIDEAGSRHINFLLRGPDARHTSTLGAWDEYRLEYSGNGFVMGVGDLAYALSPLTEFGRYGRGVQARLTTGDWNLGLYEMSDRFVQNESRQLGASASRALSPTSRVGLNYLAKSGAATANIYSIQASEQDAGFSAEAELATSDSSSSGRASRAYLYDGRGRLRYSATALYAEPQFAGYYRDQALLAISGNYALASGFGLRTTAFWQRTNLDRLTGRPALEESRLELGLEAPSMAGIALSADVLMRRTRDLRPVSTVDLLHPGVRVNASYSSGAGWGVAASGELGATQARVSEQRYTTSLAMLSTYWHPSERHSYSVYLLRDDNTYSTVRQAVRTIAGISAAFQPWDRARLSLNLQHGTAEGSNRFLTAGFEQTLRGGQTISLMVRHASNNLYRQTDAQLVFTVPLDLPVARRPDLAPVSGRLVDIETGAGLAGVPLSLDGVVVMTDAHGYFRYEAARAGRRYLTLAGGGAAAGKVPLMPFPHEMDVRANGDNYVEIRFVRPGTVKGRVQRHEHAAQLLSQALSEGENQSMALTEGHGLAGALVIVSNADITYRRLTDADGRFRIDGLPPGKWLVRLDEGTLPLSGQYQIEQLGFPQDVRSGEEIFVDFKLRPLSRRLKLISVAPVISDANSTARGGRTSR